MDECGRMEIQAASLGRRAFTCPHCHAHAQQSWWALYAAFLDEEAIPTSLDPERVRQVLAENPDDDLFQKYGLALLATDARPAREKEGTYLDHKIPNLHLSRCFVCKRGALWLGDRIINPVSDVMVVPNEDLPDDVRDDFMEAAHIAHLSPRGAAALLRLALEKLCRHLGKTGKIDTMIAELVTDGLNMKVQQALDVVRVIGNESVHPGSIDLRDDHATVQALFRLVNIVSETMITDRRKVAELFNGLPAEKLAGIQQRNERALKSVKKI